MISISIRMRLWGAVAFLFSLLIIIALLGQYGMSKAIDSLQITYSEKLAGSLALSRSESSMLQIRTTLDRAAMTLMSDPGETLIINGLLNKSKYYRAVSDAEWSKYVSMRASAAKYQNIESVLENRRLFFSKIDIVFTLISEHARDSDVLHATISAADAYTVYFRSNEKLKIIQTDETAKLYSDAYDNYKNFRIIIYASLFIAAIAAFMIVRNLLLSITIPLNSALGHFSEIAQGDLRRPVSVTSADEMGKLLHALSTMKLTLGETVRAVRNSAENIAGAAGQIAAGNLDLSSRTEEQAAALEETAASMAELTETVKNNAENAVHANQLTLKARQDSEAGSMVVRRVTETMHEINSSSKKIADIISIIEGIAFQTNILALNAAVEAARAGEEGRGFAVVAGEVRVLAQRSASAAKDIKILINAAVESTGKGELLVGETNSKMQEISISISRVTKIVEEISTASKEQSNGINQVAQAVVQMDEVTQQNAALVEEASAAAQSMASQTQNLRTAVSTFLLP